jgi:hypothetical protein
MDIIGAIAHLKTLTGGLALLKIDEAQGDSSCPPPSMLNRLTKTWTFGGPLFRAGQALWRADSNASSNRDTVSSFTAFCE